MYGVLNVTMRACFGEYSEDAELLAIYILARNILMFWVHVRVVL